MKKKGMKVLAFAVFSLTFTMVYGNGKIPIIPANILGFFIASGDTMSMVIDPAAALEKYYPKACTNLVAADWADVPHSDDGVNAFVITNLAYSTPIGGGSDWIQIYLESFETTKFFGIGGKTQPPICEAPAAPASAQMIAPASNRRPAADNIFDTEPGAREIIE